MHKVNRINNGNQPTQLTDTMEDVQE